MDPPRKDKGLYTFSHLFTQLVLRGSHSAKTELSRALHNWAASSQQTVNLIIFTRRPGTRRWQKLVAAPGRPGGTLCALQLPQKNRSWTLRTLHPSPPIRVGPLAFGLWPPSSSSTQLIHTQSQILTKISFFFDDQPLPCSLYTFLRRNILFSCDQLLRSKNTLYSMYIKEKPVLLARASWQQLTGGSRVFRHPPYATQNTRLVSHKPCPPPPPPPPMDKIRGKISRRRSSLDSWSGGNGFGGCYTQRHTHIDFRLCTPFSLACTAKKIPFMYSFSGNSAASAPISTFMCLWAI